LNAHQQIAQRVSMVALWVDCPTVQADEIQSAVNVAGWLKKRRQWRGRECARSRAVKLPFQNVMGDV